MSNKLMKTNRALLSALLCSVLVFIGAQAGFAGDTWDGGGANIYWGNVTNWSGNTLPATTITVIFGSGFGSGTSISLNGNRTVGAISITNSTDFSLNSNVLTITSGDITRSATSGTTTINSDILIGADASWDIVGDLVVNGDLGTSEGDAKSKLTKSGTGTLTLSGAGSYGDKTTISAGTIIVKNSSAFGSKDIDVVSGAVLALDGSGGNLTIANKLNTLDGTGISGGGALRNLSGDNSFTLIAKLGENSRVNSDAGTLTFADFNTNAKNLTVGGAGNVTISGVVSDSGALIKDGSGTLTLAGANTYSGTTTISNGTLQVGNDGTSGTLGTGNVANYASLVFKRSNAHTVTNVISGTGSLTQSGAGTTTLIGANSYTGPTTISAGTLQVGNGGTSGTLGATGNVTNNSALVFNRSNALTLTNVIYGTGSLTNAGAGTTALLGANLFSGATRVAAGKLIVSNSLALQNSTLDYNTGDGVVSFGANSTSFSLGGLKGNKDLGLTNLAGTAIALTVGQNNQDTVYYGVLAAPGRVIKTGTGKLTLAGDSTYTNTTTVSTGSLIVNGSLQSKQMTVESGGTLGGTGTVQAVTMNSGATLAVGTATPGTMNFNANLSLQAGATNRMRIASANSFDVLKGNGANTLSLSGPMIFDFTGNTTVTNGSTFAVLQNWGSRTALGSVSAVGLSGGLSLDSSGLGSSGILTVIPEPATGALFGIVTLVSFLINRRRSSRRL